MTNMREKCLFCGLVDGHWYSCPARQKRIAVTYDETALGKCPGCGAVSGHWEGCDLNWPTTNIDGEDLPLYDSAKRYMAETRALIAAEFTDGDKFRAHGMGVAL
jgi:hypothetical protein